MSTASERTPAARYRFGSFLLSPARRMLLQGGREVPLIPRYFDLLLLLVERRSEAVLAAVIFDSVWSDVVVSDGALSQAVRTLRRALGDDPREPRYIRTVSRHGYQFVFPEVSVDADGLPAGAAASGARGVRGLRAGARRRRRPCRSDARRAAASGGALAGLVGGSVGGLLLRWAGGSHAPATVGHGARPRGRDGGGDRRAGCRHGAGARRGAGARARPLVLLVCGSLGGGAVGLVAHALGRWTIEGLFGRAIPAVGGVVEGLAIGAVVGLAYGLAARPPRAAASTPRRERARRP